ncbi:spore germination protein GerW family protein [Actinophytocola sp. NPDC049390]|uniref:spore germination protein GerW family protein n=1 Tax=Actinophytocola sp. NPDC049390 TaxID=3363894 RepID=UPI00378FF943
MTIEELFAQARNSVEARMVFAEPIEKDGTTVIPAARVAVGGGGGNGRDEQGRQGEGGGLGLTARPVGAYVIADGVVRWEPAVDVNRIVAVVGSVAVAGLLFAARAVKHRTRPHQW